MLKGWGGGVVGMVDSEEMELKRANRQLRAEREQIYAIQAAQRHFLELLARGGGFSETLQTLVRLIEEQWPGMLGLVLLLDENGKHLHVGASVSLPPDYVQSIEGLEIGPMVGSCGTACYLRERVVVEDIARDPRWAGLRSLALAHGLRACWSEPVFSAEGEVMGTFAMYYRHPRAPTEAELRTIEMGAHLVGIAVERKRTREALQSAYQTLERRVEERTRELATLLEISHNVASTLELDPLLGLILDQLRAVVDYDAASIMILTEDMLDIAAYRGPIPYEEALGLCFSTEEAAANRAVIRRREPIIIKDVRSEHPLAAAFRRTAGDELDGVYRYIRCWMGVPLVVRDRVVGMLTLDHNRPGHYSARDAELVMAFADQVAVAIENAQLYEREQERFEESERRRQVAEGLREILGVLNSNRPLDEVLEFIVAQMTRLLDADGDAIYRLNREEDSVAIVTAHGMSADFMAVKSFPLASTAVNRTMMQQRPFVVPDFSRLLVQDDDLPPPMGQLSRAVREHFGASLTVPLTVEDEIYGAISLYYRTPHAFVEEEIGLAESFADQAALAIGNARLRDQAEKAAVSAERSRLARDLHDAVTQTLFSASLIAEVLPRIWEGNPEMGQHRLEELRELTRGALAEMRTLLLELRPSSLEDAPLRDLLRQLAESIIGRARVPVRVEIEGECSLSPTVKVALYRIAQEALNNVAKHAAPTRAEIRLCCRSCGVELFICDDGKGFDRGRISPDSLGLGIMHERAEAIGAELTVDSEMGRGTRVEVVWSRVEEEDEDKGRRSL